MGVRRRPFGASIYIAPPRLKILRKALWGARPNFLFNYRECPARRYSVRVCLLDTRRIVMSVWYPIMIGTHVFYSVLSPLCGNLRFSCTEIEKNSPRFANIYYLGPISASPDMLRSVGFASKTPTYMARRKGEMAYSKFGRPNTSPLRPP